MGSSSVRLLICAGGTGGGVYPALAVLKSLQILIAANPAEKLDVLWVGSQGGIEMDLVQREGIAYNAIPAAGVHGVGLRALPGNILRLWRGFLSSLRILRRFQPQVVFFTGGYVAVPMAVAGRLGKFRPRSLLYVPDIEPGLALKTLARFCDAIAATAEATRRYLPAKDRIRVTGYPTRPDLAGWDVHSARAALELLPGLPTLLVFGGSTGARSINRALVSALPELLSKMQIIHVTGYRDWTEMESISQQLRTQLPAEHFARYRAYPYLHSDMGAALQAADLVLSRAGASTLGEFPLFGLPAILVPYPYAWRYQHVNAEYLADHGAAVIIEDHELPQRLATEVSRLMVDHIARQEMAAQMRALATPQAGTQIAELLRTLAVDGRGAA